MTWIHWAQQIWPGLTDEEAEAVLWNCTSFPLGPIELVEKHLKKARDESGGVFEVAMQDSMIRLHDAMEFARAPHLKGT